LFEAEAVPEFCVDAAADQEQSGRAAALERALLTPPAAS
jgi:hypothetical protein